MTPSHKGRHPSSRRQRPKYSDTVRHTLRDDEPVGPKRKPVDPADTIIMQPIENLDAWGVKNIPMPEFKRLAEIISSNFGIKVGPNKRTLVTGRMHPMLERHGFADHRQLLDAIEADKSGALLSELANRISTNHTAFYREDAHFRLMRDQVLPEMIPKKRESGRLDLRIWCAACATGEEAYTILFTIMRFLGLDYSRWRAGVLATDISAAALETARIGRYNATRISPIPLDVVNQYFTRIDEDCYEVKPEIRKEVTFRRLNLINDSYPFKEPFDIIFCRNVMIYLNRVIRLQLLSHLHDWLVPGGVLFMGHSESLVGAHSGYEYLAPAAYRRCD